MYDKNLRVPEDRDILFHVVYALALRTFVAAVLHFLWCCERLQAFVDVDVSRVAHRFPRYLHREVHEAVEGVAFVVAFLALDFTAKLSLEQICYY